MKNNVISFELSSFRKEDFITNMHLNKVLGRNFIYSLFNSVKVLFIGRTVSLSKEQVNLIIKDSNLLGRLEKKGIKERLIEVMSGENADASMKPPSPPSKSMVQKQSMHRIHQSEANNNLLSSNDTQTFDAMRKRHAKLLVDVRAEEKKNAESYKRYTGLKENDEGGAMGATCKGGATACKLGDQWVESDSGSFSVQSSCAFLRCKSELNNALKNDFPDCSIVVNQILNGIESRIDAYMNDEVFLNKSNTYAKRFRDLKSAVLADLGICSMDDFAKNMSREKFKVFQKGVEEKVLRKVFNDTSLSAAINSLIDPLVESIKRTTGPSCEWLLFEEIGLIKRIGGFDNLDSVRACTSKEDRELLKKVDDAKAKMKKMKDEAEERNEYFNVDDMDAIDLQLIEQGNDLFKRIEKDEKTLETIKNKIINHADQDEVTNYKNRFYCFLDDKNNFNKGWSNMASTMKDYARCRIKKNMVTFGSQPPISDKVINSSANKYQLNKGDGSDAPYLFNPQNNEFVLWDRASKCFLEGCTKGEAELSYSENKPLLCLYDELCFFSKDDDDIKVKAKAKNKTEDLENRLSKINPPVIISSKDEVLKVDYSTPYTEAMMTDLKRKISHLETACKRRKEYQKNLNDTISRIMSNRVSYGNKNSIDITDKNNVTKLISKYNAATGRLEEDLGEKSILGVLEENNDEYPVWGVLIKEIDKICYDVVDDYVKKVKNDMDVVTCNIYGKEGGLSGDELQEFTCNMYELRFECWDDVRYANDLKAVLFDRVIASMSNMDKDKKDGLIVQNVAMKNDIKHLSEELIKYNDGASTEKKVRKGITDIDVYIKKLCDLFYKMKNQSPAVNFLWLPQGTVLTSEMIEQHRWTAIRGVEVRTSKYEGVKKLPLKPGQRVEMTTSPCIQRGDGSNGNIVESGFILTKERVDALPPETETEKGAGEEEGGEV